MQGSLLAGNLRKVISLVDNLRDLGLEQLIKLPKVVVVGSQSSGKSSLLEQIVGIDFLPRGCGVVTRRPLELRLTYDESLKSPIARFDEIPNTSFKNFNEVRTQIQTLTDKVCGSNKGIVNKPIILNISSNSCPNITIVDLPGITSIPVGNQPNNIYDITKDMVLSYIKDERSIILCVIPANQDLSTSEALKITQETDPRGRRSLGCLTKIDIMDRGTNARNILLNNEIPLKYGYVAIKNRSQQDINQNIPVAASLQQQNKFFANSPVYSTLPPGCTGTQALTDKITKILYNQIRQTMPEIVKEISSKSKEYKDKLDILGPGVAKTPQELIDYVWKMIAKFLRIYKNCLDGMRDSEYKHEPFGPKIRKLFNEFYKDLYEDPATEDLKEEDIQQAMYNFPGNSIPGFPSIDAFLALLNPLLAKLKSPALFLIEQVYKSLEEGVVDIIDKVMLKKYPMFNQRFLENMTAVLEKSKQQAKNVVQELLDSELEYLYTNDISYLMGDFKMTEKERKAVESKRKTFQPLVFELRKRIDKYHNLVVRNLRDLIPKQISYFMLVLSTKELQFEAYNFIANYDKLEKWFTEPKDIRDERERLEKAVSTLDQAEKRIKRDPEFGMTLYKRDSMEQRESTPDKFIYKGREIPSDKRGQGKPAPSPGPTPQPPAQRPAPVDPSLTNKIFGGNVAKDPAQKPANNFGPSPGTQNPAPQPGPKPTNDINFDFLGPSAPPKQNPLPTANNNPPVQPKPQNPQSINQANQQAMFADFGITQKKPNPPVTPPPQGTSPVPAPIQAPQNPQNPQNPQQGDKKQAALSNLFGFRK